MGQERNSQGGGGVRSRTPKDFIDLMRRSGGAKDRGVITVDPNEERLKRHNEMWGVDTDESFLDSPPVKEQEVEEKRTVKKPFQKGSNLLLFVLVVTGIVLLFGYNIFRAFIGSGVEPKKEESQDLLPRESEQDEKQQRIDELQAQVAIEAQERRGLPSRATPQPQERGGDISGLLAPDTPTRPTSSEPMVVPAPPSPPNSPAASPKSPAPSGSVPVVREVPPPPPAVQPEVARSAVPTQEERQRAYLAERQIAERLGSFGGNFSSPAPAEPPRNGYFIPSSSSGSQESAMVMSPSQPIMPPSQQPAAPTPPVLSQELQEAERQFLSRIPVQQVEVNTTPVSQILPGVMVPGRLMSPVFGLEKWKDEEMRYPIQIEEDVLDSTGAVKIPRGSILMGVVKSVESGGVFMMQGSSLVVNGQEVPVPGGTVVVHGKNRPLMGNLVSTRQFQAIRDNVLLFLLGGAQAAAALANRPTTTSFSSSGFSGGIGSFSNSSVTQTPPPDYAAAALQGGIERLFPRLEAEINRRSVREGDAKIYQINNGASVDLYFVRAFSF
jgi:hypothetical protein